LSCALPVLLVQNAPAFRVPLHFGLSRLPPNDIFVTVEIRSVRKKRLD
jgi:hypothetical protein